MSLLEESHPAPAPASSPADPPPIPTWARRALVAGQEVEAVVQTFDDRVLVLVGSGRLKVGCLTQATLPKPLLLLPPTSPSPLPPPPPALSLAPLLGSPPHPALHALYVAQLATLVLWALELAGVPRRPVVVGLSLRDTGAGTGTGTGRDEVDEVDEREKERFEGVMRLVAAWPGPQ
ncbi:hypothetical protein Q5752_006983 [Cryptotrichosporon argae]